MNPFQEASQQKKLMTVIGVYVGVFCNMFVSTTFSGLLPEAAPEFTDGSIWPLAISISGVLGLVLMPLYGYFGAKNPALKQRLLLASLVVGALVLLGRAVAPSMMVIVVVSVFWGFVSAGIFVLGFSLIRDMFDQQKSGTYLGLITTVMSTGLLAGPVLGGILLDTLGWRILCFAICALLAVAAVLVFLGVKTTKEAVAALAVNPGKFDTLGAIALIVFLAFITLALSLTSFFPLGSPVNIIFFALSGLGLICLVFDVVKKKAAAIVPSTVFGDRNSVLLALCNFLSNFSVMSLIVFLPSLIRATMSEDPLVTTVGMGLASLLPTACIAIAGIFLGPVLGKMIAKSGNVRTVLVAGTAVRIVVYAGVLLVVLGLFGKPSYLAIVILMLVAGLYTAQNNVTYSVGPQIQIRPEIRVQSNSVIQVGQNLGGGLGTPLYTLIVALATAPFVAEFGQQAAGALGIQEAFPTIMALAIGAAVLMLLVGLGLKPLAKPQEGSGKG